MLGREPVPEHACSRTILDCNGEVQALAIEGCFPDGVKTGVERTYDSKTSLGRSCVQSMGCSSRQGGRANSNSFQRLEPEDKLGGLDGNHRRLHLEFILSVSPTSGTRTEPRKEGAPLYRNS